MSKNQSEWPTVRLARRPAPVKSQRECTLGFRLCDANDWPPSILPMKPRAGLSQLKDLAPADPIIRYQYSEPGGLIHFDIKRLGCFGRVGPRITGDRTRQSNSRGAGWKYVHVAISTTLHASITPAPTSSLMKKPSMPCGPPESRDRLLQWPRHHRNPPDD